MNKVEKKIVSKARKDKRLLNVRDELVVDIQSYNQTLLTLEKQSVDKIESLQRSIFKTVTKGFQEILAEENTTLFEGDKNKANGDLIKLNETNYDSSSIGRSVLR